MGGATLLYWGVPASDRKKRDDTRALVERRLAECFTRFALFQHDEGRCDSCRHIPVVCGYRICQKCQLSRYLRYKKAYAGRVARLMKRTRHPKMLTLTLAGHHPMSYLSEAHKLAKNFLRALKGRVKRFEYLMVEETVMQDNGLYYFHFHILNDMQYVNQAALSGLWLKITGNSMVVDVREISRAGALGYALKYVVKGIEATPTDYADFIYRKRLVFTSLDNVELTEHLKESGYGLKCPDCGNYLSYGGIVEAVGAYNRFGGIT